MSDQGENVLVICDDTSITSLIESVLSSFETYKIENRSFRDFDGDFFLKNPDCMVIIDETMNVTEALALNHVIHNEYPNTKLIALSSYPDGDFDPHFIASGADYVLSITDLSSKLPEICRSVFLDNKQKKSPHNRRSFQFQ